MTACKACRFYQKTSRNDGRCRGFPPVHVETLPGQVSTPVFHFVAVLAGDWCGEFDPQPLQGTGEP